MSIDFATLQGLSIPEGVVSQITDASGRVIWSAVEPEPSILYLRPSADISINHSLYPEDSTAAYLLISEETSDGTTTYISHRFNKGDTSTYSASSSFKFSCANLPQKYKIKSAKMVISGGITAGGAIISNYLLTATISDGINSKEYEITDSWSFIGVASKDITDFIENKSLSSGFTVTITQKCDSCSGDPNQAKNTDYKTVSITTAWIEVEYV